MEALSKEMEYRFAAEKETRQGLANSMEKRLEAMNEFRAALQDQAQKFFTRPEHEVYMKTVESDLRTLREFRANLEGKASQSSVTIALVLSAISILIGISGVVVSIFRTAH